MTTQPGPPPTKPPTVDGTSTPAAEALPAAHPPHYWYYDHHALPLPVRHRYPRGRFSEVRERMREAGLLSEATAHPVGPAAWDLLAQVHTADYLEQVRAGTLSKEAIREIGLPFSADLVLRARAAVQATVAASQDALKTGAAGVIGGGTHHAFPGHGAGYCLFSDIAVAIRTLQNGNRGGAAEASSKAPQRVAIVDLDVHQGNGNAAIFSGDGDVFTFSVHGEKNWPYRKEHSDFDLALPDGTGDEAYLAALEAPLNNLFEAFRPQLVFYQAGVDALASDRLGRLALSHQGLRARDRMVFSHCKKQKCPVVLTMGGGYGQPMEESVQAHLNTVKEMESVMGG